MIALRGMEENPYFSQKIEKDMIWGKQDNQKTCKNHPTCTQGSLFLAIAKISYKTTPKIMKINDSKLLVYNWNKKTI